MTPIKLHDLKPAPGSKTAKTRVGRGEGSKGKTAGRGTKGTKARKNIPATFEGGQMPIHMRLPKLKGFKNRFRTEYEVVNVGDIGNQFIKYDLTLQLCFPNQECGRSPIAPVIGPTASIPSGSTPPGSPGAWVKVVVKADATHAIDEKLVRRLVAAVKPAHVLAEVEVEAA